MLTVSVTNDTINQTVQVELNNHSQLDAKAARAAREITWPGGNVDVTDGKTTYRVTRSGARKIHRPLNW